NSATIRPDRGCSAGVIILLVKHLPSTAAYTLHEHHRAIPRTASTRAAPKHNMVTTVFSQSAILMPHQYCTQSNLLFDIGGAPRTRSESMNSRRLRAGPSA